MRVLILFTFISLVSSYGNAQISFYKVFSDNGVDVGQGIVQLPDSSYMVTGWSSSFDGASSQAILLKMDSLGNYIWSQDYGGPETDGGRRVLYKEGFGFFICGFTNSIGAGGFDYYLIKVDETGQFEWEQSYGGTGWEKVHDAALTRDTGTLMVGENSSNITDNKDMYIVRTNKDGDTLWTKTMGGAGDDFLTCIRQQNDSVFVIGGQEFIEDSLLTKGYLAAIKDDGTILWESSIGIDGNYWINDIVQNGSLWVTVGGTSGINKDGMDLYMHLISDVGTNWGGTEVPGSGDLENRLITDYGSSGNFYVAYDVDEPGVASYEGGPDVVVAKYLNNLAWQNVTFSIAHVDPDVSGQFIRTSDGGAILTGYTTGVVSGGNELFVAKIGPNDSLPDPDGNMLTDNIVTIYENDLVASMTIYPNPVVSSLRVVTDSPDFNEIHFINSMGQLVRSMPLNMMAELNVSDLPAGWYILEVIGENSIARKKVIVRH